MSLFDQHVRVLRKDLGERFSVKVDAGGFIEPDFFRQLTVADEDRDVEILMWNKGSAELTYYLEGWVVGESYEVLDGRILEQVFEHVREILSARNASDVRDVPGSHVQRWEGSIIPSITNA